MLTIGPALILLFAVFVIVLIIKGLSSKKSKSVKEKKVVKEEQLYKKNEPECC